MAVFTSDKPTYRHGSIVVTAADQSDNLQIHMSHTPSVLIKIERADRRDLLLCLLEAEGVEPDIIALIRLEQS